MNPVINQTTLGGPGLLNYATHLHLAPDIPLCKLKALVCTLKANLGVIEPLYLLFPIVATLDKSPLFSLSLLTL